MLERTITGVGEWPRQRWLPGLFALGLALGAGWLIGTWGIKATLVTVGLPIALLGLGGILLNPKIGLLIYVQLGFMIGAVRFIPGETPVGLSLDAVLVLTLASTLLHGKRMHWQRLRHPVVYLLGVWVFYTLLEYFNPEAPYRPAWFYHIRSTSTNWFFVAIIALVVPITKADIRLLIRLWLIWSFGACLWAFKQQYLGLTAAEAQWLADGAAKTHILWGQLRSFSFYSDASQFGAEMAGVTLICLIRMFEETKWVRRAGYALLALVFFWGFAVSGTRSAFFVLLAGFPAYLVLRRSGAMFLRGTAVAAPLLGILLFTSIGDSNYQIYRIRTALRPKEDASFLVRLENQAKLKAYMKDLPFGAGIGTATDGGARFSPWHFAAQIPPDSWYVQLWIETGVVGMVLYLLILAGIVGVGVYRVWQIRDPWLRKWLIALLAEFIGIAVMSYSNPTLGQFPTSTLLYITSILFTTGERWDVPRPDKTANKPASPRALAPAYGTL